MFSVRIFKSHNPVDEFCFRYCRQIATFVCHMQCNKVSVFSTVRFPPTKNTSGETNTDDKDSGQVVEIAVVAVLIVVIVIVVLVAIILAWR